MKSKFGIKIILIRKQLSGLVTLFISIIMLTIAPNRILSTETIGIKFFGHLPDDIGGGSVYQVDSLIQNPDNYTNITGFSVEVKLTKMGQYSGGLPLSILIVTKGAHSSEEYIFTYPDNFPVYNLSKDEIVAMAVGPNSFIGPMAFSKGKSMAEDFNEGETRTLTYDGNIPLFTENITELTMVSFTGDFEISGIIWIFGNITQKNEKPWNKVEKIEYLDISTVDKSIQNGYNYVDITIPDTNKNSYPVIFWIHGGGWSSMSRKSCILDDTKEYLLAQGYAFVSAEYILCVRHENNSISSPGLKMVYDLKAALRFIRSKANLYHLNTEYIVAMGESAGAHLALILGTTNGNQEYEDLSMGNAGFSSNVQLSVSYFGPSSMVCNDKNAENNDLLLAYGLLGDEVLNFSEKIIALEKKMSPALLCNENIAPLFITHSKEDKTVNISQSERMYDAAKKYLSEDDLKIIIYNTGSHGDRSTFDTYSAYTEVTEFINNHIKKNEQKNKFSNVSLISINYILMMLFLLLL